ncbi:PREDICTED: neuroligin-1-like [Eufriesea mexicana]|uniref:neuroligin-1-like n=1 Tax=Eufriesea mexicana TaxID=516756 RepID=UPI00083C3DAB|nr:PREDICTED: neuroligin-1-like [Eufriesea mexicana]XP_017760219.1 PREDICTED: neuroligin-1-like [Eufriesea mexicana]
MRTSSSSSARKRKRKDLSPLDPIERLPPLDNSSGLSFVLHDAHDECVDAVFHRAPVYQRCLWPEAAADCEKRRAPARFEVRSSDDQVVANETGSWDVRNGDGNARKNDVVGKRGEWREGIVQTRHENRADRSKKCLATIVVFLGLLCGHWCSGGAEALAGSQKYSTRTVRTRYGTLRGVEDRSSSSVETYYGVPYATPPVGALRYMPPVTPTPWRGTKLADTMPPACPQKPPEPDSSLPRSKRAYLERLAPFLANQSEDCLYLNLYVPKPPHGSIPDLMPALLLIHGDSYSWGAGNAFDGTALATYGRLIVVSINFRLGVLGFLKTGPKGSAQGNYGLMDLVAGLHWLHENLGAFGGNPDQLTLFGHGTGAALANFLAVSPMAKELVERVVLLGGSALSPWAIQRDPFMVKRRVAEQTGCSDDVEADDIAPCLRLRSLEELLAVQLDPPRFTSGFAPFVDGAVMPPPINQNFQPTASSSGLMPLVPGPGTEFANFGDRDLLLGLTSEEAWVNLTDEDLQNGLNETRRDRILRTYVRNTYRYHLHEIYSTLRNEYTDWERGEQSPSAICEGLLSLLGDGQVAAPLLRLALLHSASGGRGYFLHFQLGDRPSQRGEEVPYLLGIPLLRGDASASLSHANYTIADENLSKLLVHYLANFVRRGDPNGVNPLKSGSDGLPTSPPFWDSYDSINQLYLEAGRSTEMRSHYRGHKMSLWLNLLPQLHRPGYEISMRHHHLAESSSLYEGAVRPQTMALPLPAPPLPVPSPTEPSSISSAISTTECTPNATLATTVATTSRTMQHPNLGPGPNNLLRKLASSHYQSYTTALTVTIAVGVFLLLLNILIFAGIYHQRDRNSSGSSGGLSSAFGDKKKEELLEAGCSGIEVSSGKQRLSSLNLMDSPSSSPPPHKAKLAQELELQLQEFQCSPPPGGGKRVLEPPLYTRSPCVQRTRTPSPCVDATTARMDDDDDGDSSSDDNDDENLPEPPPPPKAPAPNVNLSCPGILRQPGTPGSAKKRVQIQEISV